MSHNKERTSSQTGKTDNVDQNHHSGDCILNFCFGHRNVIFGLRVTIEIFNLIFTLKINANSLNIYSKMGKA